MAIQTREIGYLLQKFLGLGVMFRHVKIIGDTRGFLNVCKSYNMLVVIVDGVVAQLVERLVRNEKVACSIHVGSTIQINRLYKFRNG